MSGQFSGGNFPRKQFSGGNYQGAIVLEPLILQPNFPLSALCNFVMVGRDRPHRKGSTGFRCFFSTVKI